MSIIKESAHSLRGKVGNSANTSRPSNQQISTSVFVSATKRKLKRKRMLGWVCNWRCVTVYSVHFTLATPLNRKYKDDLSCTPCRFSWSDVLVSHSRDIREWWGLCKRTIYNIWDSKNIFALTIRYCSERILLFHVSKRQKYVFGLIPFHSGWMYIVHCTYGLYVCTTGKARIGKQDCIFSQFFFPAMQSSVSTVDVFVLRWGHQVRPVKFRDTSNVLQIQSVMRCIKNGWQYKCPYSRFALSQEFEVINLISLTNYFIIWCNYPVLHC